MPQLVTIHDAQTGETITRELTEQELAEMFNTEPTPQPAEE